MSHIKNLEEIINEDKFGNKAKNLSIAASLQIPVPAGFAISYHAFEYFLDKNKLPPYIERDLPFYLDGLSLVSVRSSSNVEDSQDRSLAGHFLSFLNVKAEEVPSKIREIYIDAIKNYLRKIPDLKMGVLIQKMVNQEVAFGGVIFSTDIIRGSQDHFLLEISEEGCDAVVSGKGESSLIRISKKEGSVEYLNSPSKKRVKIDKEDINTLRDIVFLLETKFGRPLNIEFIKERQIYCLQVRPVTEL